jgi:hypothetical protein
VRRELKYLVREADRERLYGLLGPYVRPDAHAGGAGRPSYTVRSVYFDTPDLRDYAQKVSGDEQRVKVRVRAYDAPGGPVFLEVKRKRGGAVWKDRAVLDAADVLPVLAGGPALGEAARRFVFRLRRDGRRPVLLVVYDREPLVGRLDPSLRVTLDRRLRVQPYPVVGADLAGLYGEAGLRPALRDHFILEVKFDRAFPSWFGPVITRLGLRREALSKYGIGVETLPPRRFGAPAVLAAARLGA